MAGVHFDTEVGGDGSTVTDDSNPTTGLDGGGWRTRFVPVLVQLVAIANWVKTTALTVLGYKNAAADSATAAAASAATALNAPGTSAASSTALTLGTGAQTLTVQAGKLFSVGQNVQIARTSDPADTWMWGGITAYNSGTGALTVNVIVKSGTGTASDWTVSLSGPQGVLAGNAVGTIDMTASPFNEAHGADIASAATINLDTATGNLVDVTGTTTITAITLSEGHRRMVRFTGALTLTNGASLVLPGGANITTVAGDYAEFWGYAGGVVRCAGYSKASGLPVVAPSNGWIVKSAAYTAVSGDKVAADTSAASWPLKLPATPSAGASVQVSDAAASFAIHPLTIDPNGATIAGASGTQTISTKNLGVTFVYSGSTWGFA